MNNRLGIIGLCLVMALPSFSQKKEQERIANATDVLKSTIDNGLSHDVLSQSLCVAIFPSVKKVALGIGASYGRGVVVCRKGEDLSGSWTAPIMYSLDQGSLGLQLGSTATDFVLTVMNKSAVERMLNGKIKLGSDAAVA